MGIGLKEKYAPKLDYSLRRRFFNDDGSPKEWQDHGRGTYQNQKLVQKQINTMISCGKKVEIEFIHEKKRKDYYGYPTKTPVVFNMGDDAP